MRSNKDVDLTRFDSADDRLLLLRSDKPAEHCDFYWEGSEALLECLEVLVTENCGRRENGDLLAIADRFERGAHGDLSFPIADVAADQSIHRQRRLHILLNIGDRRKLVGSFFIRKRFFEFL